MGAAAALTQVLFAREFLIAFFGNELCIGVVLAAWFVGIGVGALAARLVAGRRGAPERFARALPWTLLAFALLLPVQFWAVRSVRLLIGAGAGEYAPLGRTVAAALLILFPSGAAIGMFFPFACGALSSAGDRRANDAVAGISRAYAFESLGSMFGGIVMTYALLPHLAPLQIVLLAGAAAIAGAAGLWRARAARGADFGLTVALLLLVAGWPAPARILERCAVELRWRGFGALPARSDAAGESRPAVRLAAWRDTAYQNLCVMESEGQYTLYANGQVMFVFPDPLAIEHSIHFLMAQNPRAQSVLLLGGNPAGDVQELLKYPLKRLVCVDLDPGVSAIVREAVPDLYAAGAADARVERVAQDAVRYMRMGDDRFDAIIVNAGDPTTTAANRFFTVEFFRAAQRRLSAAGFLYIAATSSERLQREAADMGASVYRSLRAVFPVVLATAEGRNRFFAGNRAAAPGPADAGGLTFDRQILYQRSRAAGLVTTYFRPEYFLGCDEIAADKVRFVRERFEASAAPLNTAVRPISALYNLLLWSRFSASGEWTFASIASVLRLGRILAWLGGIGLCCAVAGWLLRRPCWARWMAGGLIAGTGFCGIGLEILLIFIYQSRFGSVYTRLGLITAMFMLGLVLGAPCGRRLAVAPGAAWRRLAMLEVLLLVAIAAAPYLAAAGAGAQSDAWVESILLAAVAFAGWAVGVEYPLANRLYCDAGGDAASSAAVTDATDHFGAALGSAAAGVVLMPLLGIAGAAAVMAGLKGLGLLMLLGGWLAMRTFSTDGQRSGRS